jgi:hypothetical protein
MTIAYLIFNLVFFLFMASIWKTSDWTNILLKIAMSVGWIWSLIMLLAVLIPMFKDSAVRWL